MLIGPAFPDCLPVIGYCTPMAILHWLNSKSTLELGGGEKDYFKCNNISPFLFSPPCFDLSTWETEYIAHLKDGHCFYIRWFCRHPLLILKVTYDGKMANFRSLLNLSLQENDNLPHLQRGITDLNLSGRNMSDLGIDWRVNIKKDDK